MSADDAAVFSAIIGFTHVAGALLVVFYLVFGFVSFFLSAKFADYKASVPQIALMTCVCSILMFIPKIGSWLALVAYLLMLWNISKERIIQMFLVSMLMPIALLFALPIVLNQL